MNTSQDLKEQLRLNEAKKLRKQAEEDSRLLENRIALLKQEEQKALRKIEETRRKAHEIITARNRNFEELKKKEELKRQRDEEEAQKLEQNKDTREYFRNLRVQANQYKINRAYMDAQAVKEIKMKNKRNIENYRTLDMAQKMYMKNVIKSQQREAKEKLKKIKEDRMMKVRVEIEKNVEMEHALRKEREEQVGRMEQEEMELIQRLQHTQLLQKTAFEDLESAMTGSNFVHN